MELRAPRIRFGFETLTDALSKTGSPIQREQNRTEPRETFV